MTEAIDEKIRQVLDDDGDFHSSAATFASDDDLYQAGMTSHASVRLMLGLELAFDIEFPEELLKRQTFQSIASIREALLGLGVGAVVG